MESIPSPPQLLKAVTLTHVRYQRHDSLGHFLAWISLIPVFISLGGFVTHFVFRREIQSLVFALGLVLSQFLNDLIKSSVQQSRPDTCAALEMCDSHGWPSNHSQYMFFFSTYFSLLCLRRSRFSVAFFPWPAAVLTLYSRVYLGYHTVAQPPATTSPWVPEHVMMTARGFIGDELEEEEGMEDEGYDNFLDWEIGEGMMDAFVGEIGEGLMAGFLGMTLTVVRTHPLAN